MSHLAPDPPPRRRVELAVGVLLALIGIAVAIVAVVALHNPNGRQAGKASTLTASGSASPTRKPTTTVPSTHAPSTKPPASHPSTSLGTGGSSSTSTGPSTSTGNLRAVPLIVLNNTTTTGLAETAKSRFQQGGWTVTSFGNLDNDILSTCAYYDPSDPVNQQAALALQQQFPAIKRVVPKFDGLPSGPIVVVLTSDYS